MGIMLWPREAFTSDPSPSSHWPRPLHLQVRPFPPSSSPLPGCQKHAASFPTRQCLTDTHTHTNRQKQTDTRSDTFKTNMGQILSWIRGPREGSALQDVAVEEQVCVYMCVMSNKSRSVHVCVLCCCCKY